MFWFKKKDKCKIYSPKLWGGQVLTTEYHTPYLDGWNTHAKEIRTHQDKEPSEEPRDYRFSVLILLSREGEDIDRRVYFNNFKDAVNFYEEYNVKKIPKEYYRTVSKSVQKR